MRKNLEQDVRFLKLYSVATTLVLVAIVLAGSTRAENRKFEEIDVERINIVEADGQLRMVISNKARQHPGISNGDTIQRETAREPGILFFNQLGDEMGGLMYGANGETGHWGQLTFDRVGGDQTIGFRHLEGDNGQYAAAIQIWQQPKQTPEIMAELAAVDSIRDPAERRAALVSLRDRGHLMTNRLFLGKGRDDATMLELADMRGRGRLRLRVAASGEATLEFLDEEGTVVYSLPEDQ